MKILRFSKHLNRTELGIGNTHEGYFYLNKQIAGKLLEYLPAAEKFVNFRQRETDNVLTTRLTVGREYRLPGLGDFFQSINLATEDLIVLEFDKYDDNHVEYFYEIHRTPNAIAVDFKDKFGFEILSDESKINILNDACIQLASSGSLFPIVFGEKSMKKKRNDSPELTSFYKLLIDGKNFTPNKNGTYMITVNDGIATIKPYRIWTLTEGEV